MKSSSDMYKRILDNLHEGVYFVDRERRITYWNHGAEHLSGFKSQDVVGHFCMDDILMHVDDSGERLCLGRCPMQATIEDGQPRQAEIYMRHREGYRVPVMVRCSPIYNEEGKITGAVETFVDNQPKLAITKRLRELEDLAFLDQLTGLGNRRYAEININKCLEELKRYQTSFALAFIDIDHFKNVNDTYGHDVGDLVLKMVANSLSRGLRTAFDLVCRWGGEEFCALILNIDREKVQMLSEKLRILVDKSGFEHKDKTIQTSVSIGTTMASSEDTIETLVRRADELMYQSKQRGRNRVTIG